MKSSLITPMARQLPRGLGTSTVWQMSDARKLTLFVVDQTIPLYNVVVGDLRFFANIDQVIAFAALLDAAPDGLPPQPTWKWVFESGFEHSLDGSLHKRWCLVES